MLTRMPWVCAPREVRFPPPDLAGHYHGTDGLFGSPVRSFQTRTAAVGNVHSARRECETQCAPPAARESRFETAIRFRTLPARLRIGDSALAAALPQFHRLAWGQADDIAVRSDSLLCVR